jgi:hypothetical protein
MEQPEIIKKIWPQPVAHSGTSKKIEDFRVAAETFLTALNDLTPQSREQGLAITGFEEVIYWAVKSITHNQ